MLCGVEDETYDHLFCQCSVYRSLRSLVMSRFNYDNQAPSLRLEIDRITRACKRASAMGSVCVVVWFEYMYEV